MNSMKQYHDLMRQTTEEVNDLMLVYLFDQDKMYLDRWARLRRLFDFKKPELKVFMIRCAYEIAGGKDWQNNSPVIAIAVGMQAIIYGIYLNNMAVYKETAMKAKESEEWWGIKNLSGLLIKCGQRILEEEAPADIQILAQHFIDYYFEAMKMLTGALHYPEQFASFEDHKSTYFGFLESYGAFPWGAILEAGALLAGDEAKAETLQSFGWQFGLGINIANHLGNFAPSSFFSKDDLRVYVEQFGDLQNGFLTLPLAYVLWHGEEADKNFLRMLIGNEYLMQDDQRRASGIICNSGAFDYCLGLCKEYAKHAKKTLHKLPESLWRDYLSISLNNLTDNKYIKALKRFKGA